MKYSNRTFNYEEIIDEKTFTIPNFQRGISWRTSKKENFIETLLNGEPFGTILIYEDISNIYLVDGLQRINTIREFNNDKYSLLKPTIIDDDSLKAIIKSIKQAYKLCNEKLDKGKISFDDVEKVKQKILDKIKKNNGKLDDVYNALRKYYKMTTFPNTCCDDLYKTIKKLLNDIDKLCNIKSMKIYAIEYKGDIKRLPEIFYNLNTGGASLSKHDVLASLWNDIKYKIKDEEIIDTVYERYDSLSEQFNISITKDDLTKDGITLFEYCYAIGKILYKEEYGFTSFLGKDNDNVQPISFSLLALMIGLKENQTNEIGKKLRNAKASFLIKLKKLIIEGFDKIKEGLYDYVKSERVTVDSQINYNCVPSSYMIYHMFMAYIKKNYTINVRANSVEKNKKSGLDNWNKNYVENLHLHYFHDYISNYWNTHRQVSDLMKGIQNDDFLYKYAFIITDEEWNEAFDTLKAEQMAYKSKSFHMKTKLLLDYLIKFKFKHNEKNKEYFKKPKTKDSFSIDYEHIVPLARFDERGIEDIPKYSLGNACFLTSKVNKSKGLYTLYEQEKQIPGFKVDKKFLELISYPLTEEELSFVELNKEQFTIKYNEFISNRIDYLIQEFKDYMV